MNVRQLSVKVVDNFLWKLRATGSIERIAGSGRPRSSQNRLFCVK